MILCKNCGWPIERITTNLFARDGSDYAWTFEVGEPVDGVAKMELPTCWTGYELSEEEMMESIRCPHCKAFPFSESAGINVETVVRVVCFEEGGKDEVP